MRYLSDDELNNISGGAFSTPFDLMSKIYRTIKIKLLVRKLFAD